jgi:hypothetical protein
VDALAEALPSARAASGSDAALAIRVRVDGLLPRPCLSGKWGYVEVIFLPEMLRRQPSWLVLFEALVLVGLIGWFDYATGWEWSCFAPYALPIVLVVWKTDRRLGFAFAFLCAMTF